MKSTLIALHRPLAALSLVLAVACTNGDGDDEGGSSCVGGKCDAAGELGNELAMFDDAIAKWLRGKIDADGLVDSDYLTMLEEIATQQGCGVDTIDSYVISDELVVENGSGPFPRVVNTVCSTDRTKADLAFFALSFPDATGKDVDVRRIEMFAWDNTARRYRFYKTEHAAGSATQMEVHLEPAECAGCHGTPKHIDDAHMHLQPIMNELAAPWEHWFAEPLSFNHVVSDEVKNAENFKALAGEGSPFRKSAARLEQTIRGAYAQRVAPARLRERRDQPADVEQAMALLRPLFCDEQVTYVTEDGSSGILSSTAVVDDGLHSAYFAIKGTGWSWEWWNDRILRLAPPGAPDAIDMMPVRGAAVVAYEKQFLAARALEPMQVMQIRALDWGTPALSEFRCDLWHSALDRAKANPPPIAADTRNMQIFGALLDEILTIVPQDHGLAGEPVRIAAAADKIVSLQKADIESLQALVDALAAGDLASSTCDSLGGGVCEVDIDSLGALIEARFKAIEQGGRDFLNAERNARACEVEKNFPNKPFIPNIDCGAMPMPPEGEGGDDGEGGTTDDGGSTGDGGDTGSTGGGAETGDCCEAHAGSGCSVDAIETCVCAMDEFCCTSEWDSTCVGEVDEFGCEPGCG
jgi:hypothetical protein